MDGDKEKGQPTGAALPDVLPDVLERARSDAEFEAILLIDLGGHVLSAARSDDIAPDTIEALLDVALRIVARPEDRVRLAEVGESTFFDWEGRQIVCRQFLPLQHTGTEPLVFVVLAPRGKTYKRALSGLVRDFQRVLGW